jgi:hypothetical protein
MSINQLSLSTRVGAKVANPNASLPKIRLKTISSLFDNCSHE